MVICSGNVGNNFIRAITVHRYHMRAKGMSLCWLMIVVCGYILNFIPVCMIAGMINDGTKQKNVCECVYTVKSRSLN